LEHDHIHAHKHTQSVTHSPAKEEKVGSNLRRDRFKVFEENSEHVRLVRGVPEQAEWTADGGNGLWCAMLSGSLFSIPHVLCAFRPPGEQSLHGITTTPLQEGLLILTFTEDLVTQHKRRREHPQRKVLVEQETGVHVHPHPHTHTYTTIYIHTRTCRQGGRQGDREGDRETTERQRDNIEIERERDNIERERIQTEVSLSYQDIIADVM
jgi:hypothetical protein